MLAAEGGALGATYTKALHTKIQHIHINTLCELWELPTNLTNMYYCSGFMSLKKELPIRHKINWCVCCVFTRLCVCVCVCVRLIKHSDGPNILSILMYLFHSMPYIWQGMCVCEFLHCVCVCWSLSPWVCPLWTSMLLILLGGDCCQSATLNQMLLREKALHGWHASGWELRCKHTE